MVLEAWELDQRSRGNVVGAEIARVLRKQYGDIPLGHQTIVVEPQPTEAELDKEWQRQAAVLADRFAEEVLGKGRYKEYQERLPKFFLQPENYKGRFDTPLLVQVPTSKLTLARMCEILRISNYLIDSQEVKDWVEDPEQFKTPGTPYATWIYDGRKNLNRKPVAVRQGLASDERAGTTYDGLGLYIQHPEILKDHFLDLPGSQYGSVGMPCLRFWGGRAKLRCGWVEGTDLGCGSIVAGRKIVTG